MLSIFFVALALCVDSFVVSAAAALSSTMTLRRGLLMACVFAFFQGLFPLLGALLGIGCRDMMAAVDHWVAFGLLVAVGGKMVADAIRGGETHTMDVNRVGVMALLGVATSIDAFVVGIGTGLGHDMRYVSRLVATVTVATFLLSLRGFALGRRHVAIPQRLAGILAGATLAALGTWTLCRHLAGAV